jgi:hypothetical protein
MKWNALTAYTTAWSYVAPTDLRLAPDGSLRLLDLEFVLYPARYDDSLLLELAFGCDGAPTERIHLFAEPCMIEKCLDDLFVSAKLGQAVPPALVVNRLNKMLALRDGGAWKSQSE